MKHLLPLVILIVLLLISCNTKRQHFDSTVESLQQYETPEWFADAKFGIWICWNAYTVPAVGDWYARNMYIEGHPHYKYHVKNYGHPSEVGYKDIVQQWKGKHFNAQNLVDLFVETGAKYVVAMANHHDNFDLWNSKYHEWNSVNYGPKRDIMAEMQKAVMKYEDQGIHWGMTSHLERTWSWFQTNKGADKEGKYAGVPYDGNDSTYWNFYLPPDANGDTQASQPTNAPLAWRQNWLARCKDLIDNYDPDMFYVDGGVPFPGDDKGQTGLEMLSHLYNQSMDRHDGKNQAVMCIKDWLKVAPNGEWGHYWDGIATLDLERTRLPKIRKQPWQTDTSIGPWTYVKGGKYRSATTIIQELIDIVSKNGNMLLNVSPMSNGLLDDKANKLLKDIGDWMKINGESIYGTRPWKVFGKDDVRIVTKGDDLLYLTLFNLPQNNELEINYMIPQQGKTLDIKGISILGSEARQVRWTSDSKSLIIKLPEGVYNNHALVLKIKGNGFENFDETPFESLYDRTEELKLCWAEQRISEIDSKYKKVSSNWFNRVWAINNENSLVELLANKEVPVDNKKAIDIGAFRNGFAYIDMDGLVHKFEKGEGWKTLNGMKVKSMDTDNSRGRTWVINQDNKVAYYENKKWRVLDKDAEAIGVGRRGHIAIISNGQLHQFDGTQWINQGGKDLTAVDISLKNDVIVTLDKKGQVAIFDGMDWLNIDTKGKTYKDVACGKRNDDETIVLIQ